MELIDLESRVFGNIRAREILGSHPPAIPDLRLYLESELSRLKEELPDSKEEIQKLMKNQTEIQKQINARPGAMALPQTKIKLFLQFSESYIKILKERV